MSTSFSYFVCGLNFNAGVKGMLISYVKPHVPSFGGSYGDELR